MPAPGQAPMGMPMRPHGGGPIPPEGSWIAVWLIGAITFGIYVIIVLLKHLNFVKQIDPQNNSKKLWLTGIGLVVGVVVLSILLGIVAGVSGSGAIAGLAGIIAILFPIVYIGAIVCMYMAIFKMRTSILNYYNTVEPIGLRLSPIMTFFFNIYYFQYHFDRIATWKKTGVLTPQQ